MCCENKKFKASIVFLFEKQGFCSYSPVVGCYALVLAPQKKSGAAGCRFAPVYFTSVILIKQKDRKRKQPAQ
jgi:hypothetical protein